MAYLFIGLIVGLIMGITGAGGAIISIPLFQLSMNATLKEATVLSLFTVLLGTGSNLLNRLSDVKWKLAFGLFFSGTIANFLTLPLKTLIPDQLAIKQVQISDKMLTAHINDGRTVSIPLDWFPLLKNANDSQRQNFEISPGGYGIHWPDVDEDISIKAFINT